MKIKIKDNFSTLSVVIFLCAPVQGARINDGLYSLLGKSLIREERENDFFHFPQVTIGS